MTSFLVIRDEQIAALREPFRPALVDALVAHALECHEDEVRDLDVPIEQFVNGIIDRGAGYGLVSARDLSRFLSLTMVAGDGWMSLLEGPHATAGARLNEVFRRVVDELTLAEGDA
jgi:hypothetical protein